VSGVTWESDVRVVEGDVWVGERVRGGRISG
jgi:hypothetical protein